jgi:hypothetical protein
MQHELINEAQEAMVAEETPEAQSVAELVPDQYDVDHMNV